MLCSARASVSTVHPISCDRTHRYQGTLTERVHPVLIPEQTEQLIVETALEDLDVDLVVLVRVRAEVLDLVQGNGLVLGRGSVWWRVVLWVRPEGANVNLPGGDGTVGVDLGEWDERLDRMAMAADEG